MWLFLLAPAFALPFEPLDAQRLWGRDGAPPEALQRCEPIQIPLGSAVFTGPTGQGPPPLVTGLRCGERLLLRGHAFTDERPAWLVALAEELALGPPGAAEALRLTDDDAVAGVLTWQRGADGAARLASVAQDEVAGSLWLACAATGPDPELGAWCGDHLRRIAPPTSVRLRWGTGGAVIAYDQLALEVTGGTPELNRTVAAHLAFHLVQDQQLALRGAATLTLHTEGGRVRELAQEGTPLGLGDAPRSWVVGGGPSASTTLQVTLRDP